MRRFGRLEDWCNKLRECFHTLSMRLIGLTFLWVSFVSISIGYSVYLGENLQEHYESLSYVTSIRSDLYRVNLMTDARYSDVEFKELLDSVSAAMRSLRVNVEASKFEHKTELLRMIRNVRDYWYSNLKGELLSARSASLPLNASVINSTLLDLADIETLIQHDRYEYSTLVRLVQVALFTAGLLSFFVILYVLLRWVIRPTRDLRESIERFTKGDLSVRVSLSGSSEFERIGEGFNRMTMRLQGLVQDLESLAQEKTLAVEERNRNLSQLYEITTALGKLQTVGEMCDSFTLRLIHYTGAAASVAFTVQEKTQRLKLVAQTDFPEDTLEELNASELYLTDAENFSLREEGVKFFPKENVDPLFDRLFPDQSPFKCGYAFHARVGGKTIGIYLLFYNKDVTLSQRRNQLYENFGTHLAMAIENGRLITRDRQFAVSQERSFLAQGLHDSIAQSLSFLNLQVQLLETAIKENDDELLNETVSQIKTGVQESYADVRELLLNFRERLHREPFVEAMTSVVDRFRAQTHIPVDFKIRGESGEPSEQEKLQIVFIMQEALANVRKHAHATAVSIVVNNGADFEVRITDNGLGIDPTLVAQRAESHFGLSIMKERAARINAQVSVESADPMLYLHGTCVRLLIPEAKRARKRA